MRELTADDGLSASRTRDFDVGRPWVRASRAGPPVMPYYLINNPGGGGRGGSPRAVG